LSAELRWWAIRRREWLWLVIASLGIVLLSSSAYLVGYQAENSQLVFSGAVVDRMDYSVHLASMHLGERGEWRYRLRFTDEPHQGAYVKSAYIFLGHAARWLRLSLPTGYQLARISFALLLCWLVYLLAAWMFDEIAWRRLAWALVVAGGGLGWLQSALGWVPQPDLSPIDFWLVDAYVFFSMIAFPHFLAVSALVILIILIGVSYLIRPARWQWPVAVLLALVMQCIQPYAPILPDLALLGAFLLHARRFPGERLRGALFLGSFGLMQIPLAWYNLAVFSRGSDWADFAQQNITLSPPAVYYVWGFAPFWIPAIAGAFGWLWRSAAAQPDPDVSQKGVREVLMAAMLVWSLGVLLLAYSPTSLQRRFLLSYTIPLGLLAANGVRNMFTPWLMRQAPGWLRGRPMLLPALIVAVTCIYSPVLALGQSLYVATRPAELFDPVAWIQAADWLQLNASEDDTVLATEQLSRLIAARTGLPVFFGHPMETLHYAEKANQVEMYLAGEIDSQWLQATNVRWVVFTARDRALVEDAVLRLVFARQGVMIYEVSR
jgi:hypothetical protein